ncbi:MAG TPA: PBP1A family penicillin-binding protein [Deltaproteobacteria bacterium]|nr:PBP1A family penicillin-binding protein [Deltaproteobacteria bacterium]HOM29107.1 PBP1A family penicillin-binding protein [Deltaproteobacteria bacterium]HPP80033.1 PBP1A family penicillin-binding protein [Deltaproteobacteria bacterium]
MRWLKFVLLALLITVCFVSLWTYLIIFRDLPSIEDLKAPESTRVSKVTAEDGTVLGYFIPEGRVVMNGHGIPLTLKQAIIAAEDSTFYDHIGLEPRRILSALVADIRANSFVQGASTITQQVVRSYLLTREKTLTRKIKEIVLALRIERALTKPQILNLYLDRVYLGSGAYGVQAASLRYFGKECRELELSEMAMIAGLAPAPARYSPLNDFTACKRRQWYVLNRMVEEGYITEEEARAAYGEPLRIVAKESALFTEEPYVTEYARTLVVQQLGEEIFDRGIVVRTSIVPSLQRAAYRAVRKGVMELEMRQGKYAGPVRGVIQPDGSMKPFTIEDKERLFSFQTNQIEWKGYEPYELYWAEVVSVEPLVVKLGTRRVELGPASYEWINPKGRWSPAKHLRPGDLIMVCYTPQGFVISQKPTVQGVLLAFDLNTGGILAMVGGVDYSQSQFNRAVFAKRQSGSAIKPFIYAAAIDKGMTPATIVFDAPVSYNAGADEEPWQPKNFENKFFGATSLRTGLVLSRNVVTIKILGEIGIDYAREYIDRFDMKTKLPRNLSIALGSADVTPYNLFKGYAVFALYGRRFEPHLIESVVQSGKGTILQAPPPIRQVAQTGEPGGPVYEQVISPQTAYIVTDILKDVVREGTGWRAKALGRPVAGKTGTSDDSRDTWFVGYTPDVLCGVWIGYDDMRSLGASETGGRTACPVFVDFMVSALRDRQAKDFNVPEGVVFARVDPRTGKVQQSMDDQSRFEVFKEDSVPVQDEQSSSDQLLKEVF